MGADLVLRDVAIDAGLGLTPTRDLALWGAAQGGELGALASMVLEGSAVPVPLTIPASDSAVMCGSRLVSSRWSTVRRSGGAEGAARSRFRCVSGGWFRGTQSAAWSGSTYALGAWSNSRGGAR